MSSKSSACWPLFARFSAEVEISLINKFIEESLELMYGIREELKLLSALGREEFEEELMVICAV